MEAYVSGVSTRSVDDLVAAWGSNREPQIGGFNGPFRASIKSSGLQRLFASITSGSYVYFDATYLHVRNQA